MLSMKYVYINQIIDTCLLNALTNTFIAFNPVNINIL